MSPPRNGTGETGNPPSMGPRASALPERRPATTSTSGHGPSSVRLMVKRWQGRGRAGRAGRPSTEEAESSECPGTCYG